MRYAVKLVRGSSYGLAAVVGLVALVVRLYRLDAQSLWLDEGGTWQAVAGQRWSALLADLVSPESAYPLYHLLLKGWLALAGDSEWALRFPSALAGALTASVLVLAAQRLVNQRETWVPMLAGGLFAIAPFALWHAQDAKAYSLLMLAVALLLWATAGVIRRASAANWLTLLAVAAVSVFVHRLALLPIAGMLVALAVCGAVRSGWRAGGAIGLAAALGAAGVYGLSSAVVSNGWQESGHQPAGPLQGTAISLSHFLIDSGTIGGEWGVPLLVWLLPGAALACWGAVRAVLLARAGERVPLVALCGVAVPLLLFALALARAPIYEARYATIAFPAFALLLALPFGASGRWRAAWALLPLLLVVNAAVLFQPRHGLFSGAPVKEEWRSAIGALAARVHPDDLVVIHPYYTLPLWQYYAPRVTPDLLPQPVVFSDFGQGDCVDVNGGNADAIRECLRRRYDVPFNQQAFGKKRTLLLIAPDHASTIDRPKTLEELQQDYAAGIWPASTPPPTQADAYGWVGLRYSISQNTWACGEQKFLGVEVWCQSFPSAYGKRGPESEINPAVPLSARFGEDIRLRGYSLDLLGGAARAGGSLPVTLYWEAEQVPQQNYSMFLHLCQDCTMPPVAGTDTPPLWGQPPAGLTSLWLANDPVHDERTLALPADLAPGTYTLLLGVRPADNPAMIEARLPVSDTTGEVLGGTRLVLGSVTIAP